MKQTVVSYPSSADERAVRWPEVSRPANPRWLLVVDDDQLSGRSVARWAAQLTGASPRVACTLHQAECWLSTLPPPIAVVSDFDLQGEETGVALLQRLAGRGLRCPAAIFTGAPEAAAQALEAAALDSATLVVGKAGGCPRLCRWLGSLSPAATRAPLRAQPAPSTPSQ